MKGKLGFLRTSLAVEWGFALLIIAALIRAFAFMTEFGYFPQPFFYDIGDAWMDWFNPAYWSHVPGAYDSYKTIYPPLTYVILAAITDGSCYQGAQGGWARDCDVVGIFFLHFTYFICVVLTALTLKKVDPRTAVPRSLAISIGLPMLWGLDRGNVILLTYIFVLLAFGPLLGSARWRWVFAGLAVNMKVYLVGVLAAQLLHRRWRWFEGALLMTIMIYLVTYAIFGSGSPFEIYGNITSYAEGLTINNPLDLWMASSLKPLLALSGSEVFPALLYVGSANVDLIETVIPPLIMGAQATIMASAAACILRPEVVPRYRMVGISIGIAIMSTEVSAYTQILVILFVFMEPSKGFLRRYAILVSYLICIPYDIDIDRLPEIVKESFWLQRPVIVEYVIQIGPFVRPLLTMTIPVSLAILTIIEVWDDVRQQGWATRWRYRQDAPLLPFVQSPSPPAGR